MPDWKPQIRQRLAGLQLAPTREAAIVEELTQDLGDCYATLLASGVSDAEAYQQTLAELQGSALLRRELQRVERHYEPEPILLGTNRRTNMIAEVWQDLRFGARILLKNPGLTLAAVIALALIGANTVIFRFTGRFVETHISKGGHHIMQAAQMIKNLCFLFVISLGIFASPSDSASEIDRFMTTLHERGQFSGSIVVAKDGKLIYRKAFGEADWQTHGKFTPTTISNLASVSKQFTAMAVMMLAEQRKLQYDDSVTKYLPELSGTLNAITLRHLLQHASGIPDLGDLGIDRPQLTNDGVIQRLTKPDFRVSPPGEKYRYSNTNYILLAVVVERVAKQSFIAFLTEKIFKPLAMTDTSVNSDTNGIAKAYDQFGNPANASGRITGHGGMYSTVDDLLKWDQALYTERLVRQSTLAEAFTPGQVKTGASTYGFGWNIGEQEGQKFVWHQGSTGGYRALIKRMLAEKITIIILTNHGNSKRLEISDAILNMLRGKAYAFPKRSIAATMYQTLNKQGLQASLKLYETLRAANDATYDFGEGELNSLGYQVLGNRKTNEAIEIFKLNTITYPQSSNAFDSLGEAYQVSGNKELAVKSYQKAVELDPTNLNAIQMLKKLQ